MELCPLLGISIPVGKDSMSMKTTWSEAGVRKEVIAPLSLIVSAFARVTDVRKTLTPQLRLDCGGTVLVLLDLGAGKNRLGGSALAQVYGQTGGAAPDVDEPQKLANFFAVIQKLNGDGRILAYHDRADGGLFVTLCEMAFAARAGLDIELPRADALAGLFNEELGAVLQVRESDLSAVRKAFTDAGLAGELMEIGKPVTGERVRVTCGGAEVYCALRTDLHRAWSETTFHMQRLRDNADCAREEFDRIKDREDPGLSPHVSFDPAVDVAAPLVGGARPRIAILREQGVNGQIEMGAAFERAGFDAYDVHMSDIIAGRTALTDFKGFAACGGFSYGDVLGAGEGWAKSILFNRRARDEFAAFFQRGDSFALGVCNGCQMMSNLREIIPGAGAWPHFVRNKSEQFEARFVMVEVPSSPSLFFADMAGSRLPVVVAHGEGYAEFTGREQQAQAIVALRFVDNRAAATEYYPYNPNGSPDGITGLTTGDGRFTVLMPHPERVFRSVQNSWHPAGWGADAPWLRMFRNARKWVG
jgi:phosphoribosylformylglycinamidine synthase